MIKISLEYLRWRAESDSAFIISNCTQKVAKSTTYFQLSGIRHIRCLKFCAWLCMAVLLHLPVFSDTGGEIFWKSVRDEVFLQEIGRQIPSKVPLTAVAFHKEKIFVGTTQGLKWLNGSNWVDQPLVEGFVRKLLSAGSALWVITSKGVFCLEGGGAKHLSTMNISDMCLHQGSVVLAAENKLWHLNQNVLKVYPGEPASRSIQHLVSHNHTLYVCGHGSITTYADNEFATSDIWNGKPELAWDWGELPSANIRGLLSLGNRLYIGTDRGLGVLRGMNLSVLRGAQGLCQENITCLARGFTNDLWLGTTDGAIRYVENKFHYFAGKRWLPDDTINAIVVARQSVYLATAKGLAIIEYRPFTLLSKARFYEQSMDAWGQRRLGFIHKLEWDDSLQEYVREISDNDGGYTEDYLVAQSYRYAVTKEPDARRLASNTFHSMLWLERITQMPGFPARSIWAKGERGHKSMYGSGGYPAEWHDAKDGKFEWKGDTSSDEISAHFYGIPIYLELAAQGDEVKLGKEFLARIARHLQVNRWRLIDIDGKPTRWGRWDPEYFSSAGEGFFARGLNSLECLSFMKTAMALTGLPEFATGYETLVHLGYPNFTIRQSTTFPPEAIAHFDDQLAFFVYGNLIRHEADPNLRSTYIRSLERSWEIVRIEQNPWYNFVYGMCTGNDCEVEQAVEHLRAWPLDMRVHTYRNSHRSDYQTLVNYTPRKGGVHAFPPRETQPMRWDHWTLEPDGGNDGRDVEHPVGWLVAYWLGRYHGFITAPDDAYTKVGETIIPAVPPTVAKPYQGPIPSR